MYCMSCGSVEMFVAMAIAEAQHASVVRHLGSDGVEVVLSLQLKLSLQVRYVLLSRPQLHLTALQSTGLGTDLIWEGGGREGGREGGSE